MKKALLGMALLGIGLVAAFPNIHAAGLGDQVAVVYNTRVPESKDIAEHYAERRQVPAGQVFGLDLPNDEIISRADYRDLLEKPLIKALQAKRLLRFGAQTITTNGTTSRLDGVVLSARIRYLVLCYGVPLKIDADPTLSEPGTEKFQSELRRNEAAVDSELACLPLAQRNFQRAGPLMNRYYRTTNAAAMNPTNGADGILLVARLDGPTAGIARALVDKAMQAEADGLWGRAYFDLRGITNGPYKIGDDWMRHAAEACYLLGFETAVDQRDGTFSPGFPLSQVAFYAGWYDGNVSGPFAQPTVEFMPGAFAYHLHSFSATTLRSTTRQWVGPLLAKGATATMGCVYEPYLTGTPDIGTFFPRFIYSGFTFGEAAYACQTCLSWQTTVVGDPLYRPFSRTLQQQWADLQKRRSSNLDWCYLRMVDLQLANREPAERVAADLEGMDLTRHSAVLTEKLAELYAAQGMPESSAHALQQVLQLNPTPQQRVRITMELGPDLINLGREADAYALYQQFLKDFPEYPDQAAVYHQLLALARKLGKTDDIAKYEHETSRLASPPPR